MSCCCLLRIKDINISSHEDLQPLPLRVSSRLQSIQSAVGRLSAEELLRFKVGFCQWESRVALTRLLEGDLLDLVDRMLEVLGEDGSAGSARSAGPPEGL